MSGNYWSELDGEDLDSDQGKDELEDEDIDCEEDEDIEPEIEYGCSCGYFCMNCLGMSWNDFM